MKKTLALHCLSGHGIEIGAFDNPLVVDPRVRVSYVDKFSNEEFARMYPAAKAVPVDIIDDGETLNTISDSSQDFVIASHFFEHCQNPIGALSNILRVVRTGGAVFMVIPDCRFTFDSVREVTPFSHLLVDYFQGSIESQRSHCEEWVRLIDKLQEKVAIEEKINHLIDTNWPIHYHVWTATSILEMFWEIRKLKGFEYDIEAFYEDCQFEVTVVLRKTR
jgi:SAM-dependent methyltransferase